MARNNRAGWLIVPVLLSAVSLMLLVIPLLHMFGKMDGGSWTNVVSESTLTSTIWNSVVAAFLTTAISLVLAYFLSVCVERTAMPCKKLFRILLVLPMLIPSVSIGMGVVLLFGNNGIFTKWLHLPVGGVYGLPGIVMGSVLYSLPVAFLMIDNILKYEDYAPYEAAQVLGIPKRNQLAAITIPYMRKPMIAAAFSIFTLSFTDYGVPLMVGGKCRTLPLVMYQEVIGQLDFGKGCVYGSMLLIPAIVAFLLDLTNKNQASSSYVTKPFPKRREQKEVLAAIVYTAIISAVCVMPILAFVVTAFAEQYPADLSLTFANVAKTFQMGGTKYIGNAIAIALLTALIGTVLATLSAYYTARSSARLTRYLHLIWMSTAAIPGVVLGLAYVLCFKGSIVYGTLIILVMVNTVHFFASPYLMIYTSFSKMNQNLEAVASTLGISRLRLLVDILLPKCRQTVKEMFSFFFVNSMMTISAVSFLANARNKPIALMINQFEAQAQMEYAAVVSLAILIVNLLMKLLLESNSRQERKKPC